MLFIAENYVETVEKFVIINAPHFFQIIWKLLSPLIPSRSANKVLPSVPL